ncbi:hypothetical protein [Tengunoibacter tsumagoiensis]|uniref:Nucleotidyltransferase n=1 Tax=Tengunoibacter tsumagoiensis TaxID=2014871 RepID=A0A401ZZU8_9CHLR|nr:hypothetical protein [Tengunoibacter tsumagoiensis]GCE12417.1 hypothetical protein KTT_22760 [Tengunoibacter tsumagoiensis]
MKTLCKTQGMQTSFIISDLDPIYNDAVQELFFMPHEDGFAKTFPANTPHLDIFYQHFTQVLEELILQTARIHPVPWEQALLAFIQKVEQQDIQWYLAGSAALAVRGLDVAPRDLDLITDDGGAHALGNLLFDTLIQPVEDSHGWISNWFGRAFFHTRIEWIGGVREDVDEHGITEYGPTAASRLETINWQGYDILVPPLDIQLEVNRRRGLDERVRMITQGMIS